MIYERTVQRDAYCSVTRVDTAAKTWETFTLWRDGTRTNHVKMKLKEMGWDSANAFLKARPGFKIKLKKGKN